MAARVARHGARKRTAGAANALEAFAVAGGALSVVALMTMVAGGPARVDGTVTGQESDSGTSRVVSPTSVGSGSGVPRSTTRPAGTGGHSYATPPDASTAVPPGPPTTAPPKGLGPSSPLPVGTTLPAAGSTTDPVTSTPSSKPTTKPATKPSAKSTPPAHPVHPVHPTPPVTPGIPPADPAKATPKG